MIEQRSSFFIVGAPRCGTTSLSKMLARHPQVCFSRPKETHFFVSAIDHPTRQYLDTAFVGNYFPHLGPQHTTLGEGSVSTLYAPEALRRILAFDPEARFIVMVRNPVDLVYSYHARVLYLMDEDVTDFARAWALQDARRRGEHLSRRCRDPRLLMYGDVGRLGEQVEHLFEVVSRERTFVVVFDDFARDAGAVYADLCDFLRLADDGRREFPKKNDNKEFRNPLLQQMLVNPPPIIVKTMQSSPTRGKVIWEKTRRFRKWIKHRNTFRAQRPPLDPGMRAMLTAYFTEDVARLGRLLGRDLSHWSQLPVARDRADGRLPPDQAGVSARS
jgi:hypothetical protein